MLTTPDAIRRWSMDTQRAGRTVALVPTMGALHAGHLALIDDAQRRCDRVVVSIFVNPLQFNRDADFGSYPRPIDDDLAACRDRDVDAVFAPTGDAMYPAGFETRVVPGPLADEMEGVGRPGHFEGVVTVVTKLFSAVRPHAAIFGQKDYQQLVIVRRLSDDLDLGVEVIGHPIVREPDGLAMSSRNLNLTPAQRIAAVVVPRSLDAAIREATTSGATIESVVRAAEHTVEREPAARHEYTKVFDADTLRPLEVLPPSGRAGSARVATAVWFGDVRLIDNRDLHDTSSPPVSHPG